MMVVSSSLVQPRDLDAHVDAQFGVEIGERFVEQEDLGMAHDGAADGDALALAAGELLGPAVEQRLEFEDARRLVDLPGDLGLGHAGEAQREAHVLAHRHVRVERVGLEHHGDAALATASTSFMRSPPMTSSPRGDVFEPGDHAQQRRLAAARGADEDDELLGGDVEIDALDHLDGAEGLADAPAASARSCSALLMPPRW